MPKKNSAAFTQVSFSFKKLANKNGFFLGGRGLGSTQNLNKWGVMVLGSGKPVSQKKG